MARGSIVLCTRVKAAGFMNERREVCIREEREGVEGRNQPQGKTGQAGFSEEILGFLKMQPFREEVYIHFLFYLSLSTTLPGERGRYLTLA